MKLGLFKKLPMALAPTPSVGSYSREDKGRCRRRASFSVHRHRPRRRITRGSKSEIREKSRISRDGPDGRTLGQKNPQPTSR
ncbi:hypothetical protein SLA2020_491480 [Shorea laevis]